VIVVYVLNHGVLSAVLGLGGLWVFYRAQSAPMSRGRRAVLTGAAFGVLLFNSVAPRVSGDVGAVFTLGGTTTQVWLAKQLQDDLAEISPVLKVVLAALTLGYLIFSFFIPVIAAAMYARIRRARREQALLKAALDGRAGSDEFLTLMRTMLS